MVRRLALAPLLGVLALVGCGGPSFEKLVGVEGPPEPQIVTPSEPSLARLSGRWIGRADAGTAVRWAGGFSGHAPTLRVDVETVNADAMQALVVMGEGWSRLFLHAQPSPQQDIYEGKQQRGPSLYWFRLRLVSEGVLGFEMGRNTPEPSGVLVRTQLHRP